MPLEVAHEFSAMRGPLVGLPEAVDLQSHRRQRQDLPQPGQHHDQLGVDVRPGKAKRFDIDLMKLPVAPALRPLVPEHRSHRPHPPRPVIGQVVLDRRAHHARRELGAQRQPLAVETVLERVHLFLNDIGDLADALHEQFRVLDDRRADLLVAVAAQPVRDARLEPLPQRGIARQEIVHPPHAGQLLAHRYPACSLSASAVRP